MLEADNKEFIRKEEVGKTSFYFGALAILIPLNIYLMFRPGYSPLTDNYKHKEWINTDFIFRLFLFVTLIVLGTASAVQILRNSKINYVYIFGIDPTQQVTHYELYAAGLCMLTIWNACYLIQVLTFELGWGVFDSGHAPVILLTLIFIFGIMLSPFKMFYRKARLCILLTMGNLIAAPFTVVGFKDFFLGDVITSARLMLFDAAAMTCFYSSGEYKGATPQTCSW